MSTIKLDTSGDVAIENGTFVVLSDLVAETAQRLKIKFQFFLGEWHLDQRAGMPLFEKVYVKNPNLADIRRLYSEVIRGDPAVDVLNSIEFDRNESTREFSISFEATLNDGSSLTFDDFVLQDYRSNTP